MGKITELKDIDSIALHDVDIQAVPVPEGMKKVFASYNILLPNGQMGFGNTCTVFNEGIYDINNLEVFIAHLQKSIAMSIEQKTGVKGSVQVLFFK